MPGDDESKEEKDSPETTLVFQKPNSETGCQEKPLQSCATAGSQLCRLPPSPVPAVIQLTGSASSMLNYEHTTETPHSDCRAHKTQLREVILHTMPFPRLRGHSEKVKIVETTLVRRSNALDSRDTGTGLLKTALRGLSVLRAAPVRVLETAVAGNVRDSSRYLFGLGISSVRKKVHNLVLAGPLASSGPSRCPRTPDRSRG